MNLPELSRALSDLSKAVIKTPHEIDKLRLQILEALHEKKEKMTN